MTPFFPRMAWLGCGWGLVVLPAGRAAKATTEWQLAHVEGVELVGSTGGVTRSTTTGAKEFSVESALSHAARVGDRFEVNVRLPWVWRHARCRSWFATTRRAARSP